MHGSARGLLAKLMRRHGIACDEIRGTRDPLFGGVNPEPIEPHIEALRDAVREGGYDAGFAADGDGDRIGAMDRDGTFITPHQIFSILFWHLAGTRKLPGDLAKTFSTTKLLDKIAARYGRKVYEVPVGFKYICELMLERDILLGGEESGGIGTKLYLPERDATVLALLLAEVMAWHRKSLGELVAQLHAEFGEHHYGRVDLELRPGQKERAIEYFAAPELTQFLDWPVVRREDLDGIKVYLGEIGWLMVRASGTENMLRLYSETTRPETTDTYPERSQLSGPESLTFEAARFPFSGRACSTASRTPLMNPAASSEENFLASSIASLSTTLGGVFVERNSYAARRRMARSITRDALQPPVFGVRDNAVHRGLARRRPRLRRADWQSRAWFSRLWRCARNRLRCCLGSCLPISH